MRELSIGEREAGQRLDKFLKKYFSNASDGFLYKMLRKKNIELNHKKADGHEILQVGDRLQLFLEEETIEKFDSVRFNTDLTTKYPVCPLEIIYEDANLCIINKPAGMLSQKADAKEPSANEYIIGYLLHSGALTPKDLETFTPSVCNRLDRNTSGLLIAGKTLKGLREMGMALKNRSLKKFYTTLVVGNFSRSVTAEAWLKKNPSTNQVQIFEKEVPGADKITTAYEPLWTNKAYSLLRVHLITGKSHQIRSHLAFLGHPIVGDPKYGDAKINQSFRKKYGLQHQLLHAQCLEWPDKTAIQAPLPKIFSVVLDDLKKQKSEGI